MQKIEGTKITLTRGDTFKATISMEDEEGNTYTPQEGDVVRFAMKRSYSDYRPLVLKEIPNDTLELYIEPDDTKNLPFGEYCYDIQLTYANGDVDTFIDRAAFILTEEVD